VLEGLEVLLHLPLDDLVHHHAEGHAIPASPLQLTEQADDDLVGDVGGVLDVPNLQVATIEDHAVVALEEEADLASGVVCWTCVTPEERA
jgi:hypothetical protein